MKLFQLLWLDKLSSVFDVAGTVLLIVYSSGLTFYTRIVPVGLVNQASDLQTLSMNPTEYVDPRGHQQVRSSTYPVKCLNIDWN